jgi:penicillin-binding protein 1B
MLIFSVHLGGNTMKEMIEKAKEYWGNFVDFLTKKKIIKTFRVSYNVGWNLFLILIVIGVLGGSFATGVGAGYFASLVKDEPIRSYENMKKDIYNYEEATNIYFANNIFLDKLRSDLVREEITLSEVSDYVKNAVIATEDAEFERHSGVVPKAIMRALFQEATNASVKSGGSTLTQQLIKNQILTNEVNFDRKAKEIILALRLERYFNKEEILEAYLNVVPFGRNSSGDNIAGVQAAAKGIFGVDAKNLNLPQAAFIAGLPQSPFGYTPFTRSGEVKQSIEPALNRMETVLSRMLEGEYITLEQYNAALSYDIEGNLLPPEKGIVERYPYLTFEIERRAKEKVAIYLAKKDKIDEEMLLGDKVLYESYIIKADREMRRSGYNIYTTIDKQIYDAMNQVVQNEKLFGSDKPQELIVTNPDTGQREETIVLEPEDIGVILLENNTGAIKSFVGGRGNELKKNWNYATQSRRPSGSTMKPIIAYAPAIEEGIIQPSTIMLDAPLELQYPELDYQPLNWDKEFHGLMTAREALKWSWNIPAIKTLLKIDPQIAGDYLTKLGFKGDAGWKPGQAAFPSMAIGTIDVTVEEMTNSFQAIANNGKLLDAYLIEKIVSKDGEVIFEHQKEEQEVFSPQTAYLTLDMMRDVVSSGTGAYIHKYMDFNADWAGKTGTTQNSQDSIFIASNPNITLGVWIGYDTPKKLDGGSSSRSQRLWAYLANATNKLDPELVSAEKRFKMPGKIVNRSYCQVSGMLPSQLCQDLGLVTTDIFNFDYIPNKEDDSLARGKVVYAGGKTYLPNESTPEEFTEDVIYLITEGYNDEEIPYVLPRDRRSMEVLPKWEGIKVIQREMAEENGKAPEKVFIQLNEENNLTWIPPNEEDVIGYRIYQAENHSKEYTLIANILSNQENVYVLPEGSYAYVVKAVDIAGQESQRSNPVTTGDWTGEPESPLDPLDPTNPNDPNEDPSDPNDPNDPNEDPSEPNDPNDPNEDPSEPNDPSDPNDPSEPSDPPPTDPLDPLPGISTE